MTAARLPDNLREFLRHDIASVERLDVLLFLYRHAKRWWAAQRLSTELEMPADAVQAHLERLSARNLLAVQIADTVSFCYKPGSDELARLVEAVADAYYHRRDAVAAELTRKQTTDSARLFADAFNFRKGRHDG